MIIIGHDEDVTDHSEDGDEEEHVGGEKQEDRPDVNPLKVGPAIIITIPVFILIIDDILLLFILLIINIINESNTMVTS